MSTPHEIRGIEEKIRQLEALKASSAMPPDLADASIAVNGRPRRVRARLAHIYPKR